MKELICIVCPRGCHLKAEGPDGNGNYSVTGNSCPRGRAYAVSELTHPVRTLTTTVRLTGAKRSVKGKRAYTCPSEAQTL